MAINQLPSFNPSDNISGKVAPKIGSVEATFKDLLGTAFNLKDSVSQADSLNFNVINQKDKDLRKEKLDALWVNEDDTLVTQLFPENLQTIQDQEQGAPVENYKSSEVMEEFYGDEKTILPFQVMIDRAVDVLGRVSHLEARSDRLMELYTNGEVSLEEFTVVKAQVSAMLTFAINLVNQAVTIFKEIQGMQI